MVDTVSVLGAFMNIPDGWQLVPKEPTREMLKASRHCTAGARSIEESDKAVYAAMLKAAPTPVNAPAKRSETQ